MKDNYETVEGSNKVIIGTHTIDYTATGWTGKYDGKPHGITINVSTDDCEILYSIDGINYTNKRPTFTETGTYTTYFKIIRNGYETVEGSERIDIQEINIHLSDNSGTVKVKEKIDFTVDTGGKDFDVTIEDPSIASVTVKNGVVTITGKKQGKTKIKITCNGKTEEYEVTVTDDEIKLSEYSGTVRVDDTIEFDVDTNGEYFDIGVADPDIASVTVKDGKVIVTGKKAGKTTILIECNGKKAKYVVTVIDDNIKLSATDGTVEVGDSTDFIVDTGGKDFDVTISDPSIAKVTVENGVVTVTGLKAGTATITITCNGRTASYKITVKSKKATGNVSISSGNDSNSNSGTVIRSDAGTNSNVKTGDDSNILLYGMMLIASLFELNKLRLKKKRAEKE